MRPGARVTDGVRGHKMIQTYRPPRYVSEARAAIGPRRLRAFTRRVFRKRPRVCAICPSTRGVQVAHLVAVSENRALALREKNTVMLCRRCHLAFDSLVGVIPPGSRLYVDPFPYFLGAEGSSLSRVLHARQMLLHEYVR
jgi:hypothetical protein